MSACGGNVVFHTDINPSKTAEISDRSRRAYSSPNTYVTFVHDLKLARKSVLNAGSRPMICNCCANQRSCSRSAASAGRSAEFSIAPSARASAAVTVVASSLSGSRWTVHP